MIGLDPPLVEALSARVEARVVAYPSIPATYSIDGVVRVESARVAGRMLEPRGVLFYGYFDPSEAAVARRALALADTPSFPDVRRTLPLDDKAVALVTALEASGSRLARGYLPAGETPRFEGERVLKWGHRHCGEDKARVTTGSSVPKPAIVEPFIVGTSERILLVGDRAWHLDYESDDWRKNVRARIRVRDEPDAALLDRARRIASHLGLVVAGIDFVVADGESYLLEVNAYPGLDDVPDAADAFIELAARWWGELV